MLMRISVALSANVCASINVITIVEARTENAQAAYHPRVKRSEISAMLITNSAKYAQIVTESHISSVDRPRFHSKTTASTPKNMSAAVEEAEKCAKRVGSAKTGRNCSLAVAIQVRKHTDAMTIITVQKIGENSEQRTGVIASLGKTWA